VTDLHHLFKLQGLYGSLISRY